MKTCNYNTTKDLIKQLSDEELDEIYRHVWEQHVEQDIVSFASNEDIELTQDEIDHAAYLYVYEGKYDCNQSYWSNIDNVIQIAKEQNYDTD